MPRNITVTFADGSSHTYQNAPDDVTPDQVEARASQEFGKKVSALDGGRAPVEAKPSDPQGPGMMEKIVRTARLFTPAGAAQALLTKEGRQDITDMGAGLVRGAGSIGATVARPFESSQENTQRRADMDSALQNLTGANPQSMPYQAGKLGGEIAGTAGAGGVVGNVVGRAGTAIPYANNLARSISTAGMTTGMAPGAANFFTRMAGGAINGGVTAGMVDPSSAGAGAVIGGAVPGLVQATGAVGNKLAAVLRGPEQTAEQAAAIQAARDAGYVIPPTQAKPSLANRAIEGFAGKITTAQNASAKNQAVTNRLAAEAVGLPAETPITVDALNAVRRKAGEAYNTVANTGTVTPGEAYTQALDDIVAPLKKAASGFPNAKANPIIEEIDSLRSPAFDAAAGVEKIKELRGMADKAYASGDKAAGKAYKSAAGAIEDALDGHLQAIGAPADALQAFRDSRQLIAKTYTVEKALNPTTGTVDAKKLASALNRGKPLSAGLKDAAEFANRFPKAAQPIEKMGSLPQTSPLDWAALGTAGAMTSNPLMLAGVLARPAARAAALSGPVQNRLVQSAPSQNKLAALLADPEFQQLIYRPAPLAATNP